MALVAMMEFVWSKAGSVSLHRPIPDVALTTLKAHFFRLVPSIEQIKHISVLPERCRALVESQSFFLVVAVLGFATEHPPRFLPSSGCRLYLK
jgi:hypothetical protein